MTSKLINSSKVTDCLCSPWDEFSCFACCPPIRPGDYEHLAYRSSLTRLFVENRADFLKGILPQKEVLGFFCPGLGFLDSKGRKIGCLLHPMQNNGQDLRSSTGYQEKCQRESCPQSRAFKILNQSKREFLIKLCQEMDSFQFSSQKTNPVMRLLAFGPKLSELAVDFKPAELNEMKDWTFLFNLEPFWGCFLAEMAKRKGFSFLLRSDCTILARQFSEKLKQKLEPFSNHDQGSLLSELSDEWEARFWRNLTNKIHALPYELSHWRFCFKGLINTY